MKQLFIAATAAFLALASAASATTFTFSDGGGSGSGFQDPTPAPYDFDLSLTGSDDWCGCGSYTTFSTTAGSDETITIDWAYSTSDWESYWDPFGYFIGGTYTQLTANGVLSDSGSLTFDVAAGETWGFYVYSVDGSYGAASATIQGTVSPVPLPAAGLLLIGGLGGLAMLRRRQGA